MQLVDERFKEEETKFKTLEAAVKNVAQDVSVYLEQLDVSSLVVTYLHRITRYDCVMTNI